MDTYALLGVFSLLVHCSASFIINSVNLCCLRPGVTPLGDDGMMASPSPLLHKNPGYPAEELKSFVIPGNPPHPVTNGALPLKNIFTNSIKSNKFWLYMSYQEING